LPVKARQVVIAILEYKSLLDDLDAPNVAKASENTCMVEKFNLSLFFPVRVQDAV
jgi:hypothetical protein